MLLHYRSPTLQSLRHARASCLHAHRASRLCWKSATVTSVEVGPRAEVNQALFVIWLPRCFAEARGFIYTIVEHNRQEHHPVRHQSQTTATPPHFGPSGAAALHPQASPRGMSKAPSSHVCNKVQLRADDQRTRQTLLSMLHDTLAAKKETKKGYFRQ